MGLHLYSIHHADHGLGAVEHAARAVPGLANRLVGGSDDVLGAVVLATCNRLEVYLDVDAVGHPQLATHVRDAIAAGLPTGAAPGEITLRVRHASEVLWHLFEVGAGLDSLVVGEREVAGQLKRALATAKAEGTATYLLTESIEQALRTSRRVAHLTGLAANGRSVVSVGLDLLGRRWADSRVLLLGTGSYAGAVVAALAARGCHDITVHSSSGRAQAFADSHAVAAAEGDLDGALAEADVVVTCRGVGTPVLTVGVVGRAMAGRPGGTLDIVDLALARDAEPAVASVPGVRLVDLSTIQHHVPDASAREVARAEHLVAQGVADLVARLKGRQLDPAIVAMRDSVTAMVDDEIARLPGRLITGDEAAHALRRLAARLMHEPSVRVRQAAESGRGDVALAAITELYGLQVEGRPGFRPVVDPDTLESSVCPVTGFGLADIGEPLRMEAL